MGMVGTSSTVMLVVSIILVVVLLPALTLVMVTHKIFRMVAELLSVDGEADFDAIVQSAQAAPKSGEGLADALDVGGGTEIGF